MHCLFADAMGHFIPGGIVNHGWLSIVVFLMMSFFPALSFAEEMAADGGSSAPEAVLAEAEIPAPAIDSEALLAQARALEVKMDYPAALQTLETIVEKESDLELLSEGMYEMIKVGADYAYLIKYKTLLSDTNLNQLLEMPADQEITAEERNQLSEGQQKLTFAKMEKMQQELPESPWTQKALEYVTSTFLQNQPSL